MGNFFSGIDDAAKKLEEFFMDMAIWFIDLWGDFTYAYYVTRDIIIIMGPFVGFLLYALLTRSNQRTVVEVMLPNGTQLPSTPV